ncbi:hypothetical protein ACQEVM_18460 [Streptomyces sp. CA-243310]|uniref:hypothetical protein n=1 Tax=Streptomyces sp. CA-243310 TaxID=3240056 RepID=UPI003D8F643A
MIVPLTFTDRYTHPRPAWSGRSMHPGAPPGALIPSQPNRSNKFRNGRSAEFFAQGHEERSSERLWRRAIDEQELYGLLFIAAGLGGDAVTRAPAP